MKKSQVKKDNGKNRISRLSAFSKGSDRNSFNFNSLALSPHNIDQTPKQNLALISRQKTPQAVAEQQNQNDLNLKAVSQSKGSKSFKSKDQSDNNGDVRSSNNRQNLMMLQKNQAKRVDTQVYQGAKDLLMGSSSKKQVKTSQISKLSFKRGSFNNKHQNSNIQMNRQELQQEEIMVKRPGTSGNPSKRAWITIKTKPNGPKNCERFKREGTPASNFYSPFQFKQVTIEFNQRNVPGVFNDSEFEEFLKLEKKKSQRQNSGLQRNMKKGTGTRPRTSIKNMGLEMVDSERNVLNRPQTGIELNRYRGNISFGNGRIQSKSGQMTAISSYLHRPSKQEKTFDSFQNHQGESISGSPTPIRLGPINNHQITEVQPFDNGLQPDNLRSQKSQVSNKDLVSGPGLNMNKLHVLNAKENQLSDYNSDVSYTNIRPKHEFYYTKPHQQYMHDMGLIKLDPETNLHNLIDKKRQAMPEPRFNCTQSRLRKLAISRVEDDTALIFKRQDISVQNILSRDVSKNIRVNTKRNPHARTQAVSVQRDRFKTIDQTLPDSQLIQSRQLRGRHQPKTRSNLEDDINSPNQQKVQQSIASSQGIAYPSILDHFDNNNYLMFNAENNVNQESQLVSTAMKGHTSFDDSKSPIKSSALNSSPKQRKKQSGLNSSNYQYQSVSSKGSPSQKNRNANLKDLDGVKDFKNGNQDQSENNGYNLEQQAQDNMETTSHIVDRIYKESSKSEHEGILGFSPPQAPFENRRQSAGVSTINNSNENMKSQNDDTKDSKNNKQRHEKYKYYNSIESENKQTNLNQFIQFHLDQQNHPDDQNDPHYKTSATNNDATQYLADQDTESIKSKTVSNRINNIQDDTPMGQAEQSNVLAAQLQMKLETGEELEKRQVLFRQQQALDQHIQMQQKMMPFLIQQNSMLNTIQNTDQRPKSAYLTTSYPIKGYHQPYRAQSRLNKSKSKTVTCKSILDEHIYFKNYSKHNNTAAHSRPHTQLVSPHPEANDQALFCSMPKKKPQQSINGNQFKKQRPTSVPVVSAVRKAVPPLNLKQLFEETAKNAEKRRTVKPWHPEDDLKKKGNKNSTEGSKESLIDKKDIDSKGSKHVAFQQDTAKNKQDKINEQKALFMQQVKAQSIQSAFDIMLKEKSKSVVLKTQTMISEGNAHPIKKKLTKKGMQAQLKRHFSMALGKMENDIYDINSQLQLRQIKEDQDRQKWKQEMAQQQIKDRLEAELLNMFTEKPLSAMQIKLQEIGKDLRIMSQKANRIVVSKDSHPVIRIGQPLGIEVVPNVPMNFLAKVRDLPSPLKLNIKYMDRMSKKKRDLQVSVSFGQCKHSEEGHHTHSHNDKGANKFPKGPNFILIESKGGGQSLSKANNKSNLTQMTVDQFDTFDFSNIDQELKKRQSKNKTKSDNQKRFTEQQANITFTSLVGCSIQVTLEVPISAEQKNKHALKNRKAELAKLEEELNEKFTVEDPYYKEMLDQVKERKKQNRQWLQKQKMNKMVKCMDDPETGKIQEKQENMIESIQTKAQFDEIMASEGLVILYFFAAWQPECQGIAANLQDIANGLSSDIKIFKVDIDENPETVKATGVTETPAFLFCKNSEIFDETFGNLEELKSKIQELTNK